jgi:uroporphyrinogen decarboxylase
MPPADHLFLRACRREPVDRTPVWIMRQAGRYLPEYRAIREQTDFLTLCKTPELASEVTVQPVNIIGVDAAILFSDILVIPEAMGMKLEILESRGPVFHDPIRSAADLDLLDNDGVVDRLGYVYDAIRLTKEKLTDRVPLIGFSGAPWTLAAYMVEGTGSKNFDRVKQFAFEQPEAMHRLLDGLAEHVTAYLKAKVAAGCDAVQIFDTWAGLLSPGHLEEFSLAYIRRICSSLKDEGVPVIVFAKGVHQTGKLASIDCDVVGVDWTQDLGDVRRHLAGKKAVQGNLDPCVLLASKEKIGYEAARVLESFGSGDGHIFNLGHGILPNTPVENARHLVRTVAEISSRYHTASES